jgi:hypothetical protein
MRSGTQPRSFNGVEEYYTAVLTGGLLLSVAAAFFSDRAWVPRHEKSIPLSPFC